LSDLFFSFQFFYLAQKFPPKLKFESKMQIHICFNARKMEMLNCQEKVFKIDAADILARLLRE
jgi:hypothetical protein